MKEIQTLKDTVGTFYYQLSEVSAELTGIKPSPEKWSLKEILGHLIDSASNNHQRFVRLQSGDLLDFPPYDAETWVGFQKHNSMEWNTLVEFWHGYNKLLLNILENVDPKTYKNVWIKNEEAIPLEELIVQYRKHMEYHMEHFKTRKAEIGG